ncbi:MlaD family protein [Mycobacteroides chelonae]|uniref:MlaD family protein n=1 Tax=Mycobacteroides chelonae TaxID=1774 RepID=UPI000A9AD818|nr:MCE family protein [Mycobacteroides chelonae]
MITVVAMVALAIAKSKGQLDATVRVNAELINVGDGLPEKSDVKYRGVLVGSVADVVPATGGGPNLVRIDLKPYAAKDIPDTVTARVVPSNVFAVSSVQLVDNGKSSAPLRGGATIREDQSLPTVLFQTTLNKMRSVLAAVGRTPAADRVGVLETLGRATEGRGAKLRAAGSDLNEIVRQLNTVVGEAADSSTMAALIEASDGLQAAAPELFDALGAAVTPMRSLAEKRSELSDFLSAGLGTVGLLADSFEHNTDRLINITTQLTPVVGVLADNASQFHPISARIQGLANRVYTEAWNPDTQQVTIKAAISLTPSRTYVRADCPRYGALAGPSCYTAPEVPVAPDLTPALRSMGLPLPSGVSENRPNTAPPRNSIVPPSADPAAPPAGAEPQSMIVGGNVGQVGSRQEKAQLSRIVGGDLNSATELLLAPVVRGTTVHIAHSSGGDE